MPELVPNWRLAKSPGAVSAAALKIKRGAEHAKHGSGLSTAFPCSTKGSGGGFLQPRSFGGTLWVQKACADK